MVANHDAELERLKTQIESQRLEVESDRRSIVPTYPRTDGNFTIVGAWIWKPQATRQCGQMGQSSHWEAFKKFESGSAEKSVAQILAEMSAAQ